MFRKKFTVSRPSLNRSSRRTRFESLEQRAMMAANPLVGVAGLSAPNLIAVPTAAHDVGPIATPNFHVTSTKGLVGVQIPLTTFKGPYTPQQIRQAYGFDKLALDGSGQTIAIIEAFNDPTAVQDLHTFDTFFGLSDPNVTVAQQIVNGHGPGFDSIWALETALDLEWAHVIAPKANILLCQANNGDIGNLYTMVDFARGFNGVTVVSMSYGAHDPPPGPGSPNEQATDAHFTTPSGHAGVTFVASSGDSGAGTQYPAGSPNVLAVGGTSLTTYQRPTYVNASTSTTAHAATAAKTPGSTFNISYDTESAWSGSGGGVSPYEGKPSYQAGLPFAGRVMPDVAYDADPNTGVWMFDTNSNGWLEMGGTSAAAPQWAALIALANQGRALAGHGSLGNAVADLYQIPKSDFHDITSGSNGSFQATAGFDEVTGNGSPIANLVVNDLIKAEPVYVPTGGGRTPPGGGGPGSGTKPFVVAGGNAGLPIAKGGLPSALTVDDLQAVSAFQLRGHFGARVLGAADKLVDALFGLE